MCVTVQMTAIESLDISQRLKDAARKLRLTSYESVLFLTAPVGNLSADDICVLKDAVAKVVCDGKPVTALTLSQSRSSAHRRLTTGCEVLDQALRGGILCGGITEISGESASGKTQFGLQLGLTAQLPHENGGLDGGQVEFHDGQVDLNDALVRGQVEKNSISTPLLTAQLPNGNGGLNIGTIYICTEDAFPSKRLYQMIQTFSSRHGNKLCTSGNLGDKIFIEHVADYDGLMECLNKKARVLLSSGAVKLVVVDSIAAHFRSDYDSSEMFKRAKHISSMGTLLHQYSMEYNVPVVCINQVTSSMKADGRQLLPSLGLTWSNLVNIRIMLSRTSRTITLQQDSARGPLATVVREMEVVFSPHLPAITVPYVIDQEGTKGFR